MKPEEAIEVLSNELIVITDMIGYCRDFEKESDLALAYRVKRQDAYKIAISALKELQQYREIGTVEECREAVEKQKAKKPDIYTDTRNMVDLHGNVYAEQANVYLCPTCESFIGYVGNNIFHYCPVCGQAIDENLEGMEE